MLFNLVLEAAVPAAAIRVDRRNGEARKSEAPLRH
jgi:hypothetical protein